jgi:hypothetical protein
MGMSIFVIGWTITAICGFLSAVYRILDANKVSRVIAYVGVAIFVISTLLALLIWQPFAIVGILLIIVVVVSA